MAPANSVHGKLALVTGASGGIGAACCRDLARAGFTVAIHYKQNHDAAAALARELRSIASGIEAGFSVRPEPLLIAADLSTREGCDHIYETIKVHPSPLAVLVNNAGIVRDNPLFSASMDELEETLRLNVHGTWYLSKRLARLMIREKFGRIINISSVVGSTGNPTQSVYGMTKAAIDNFTKVAAQELAAHGILVNGVAPGFIDTDMTRDLSVEAKARLLERIPLGRMGRPQEIAEIVGFLATAGAYITGTTIHANGGLYGGA
ncbi:MAG: 3-oxoacyl-ACP reductase family protein [Leptospirales bacterium]|jgi:3-oxoacyl-[acyl-carrier protein] reductase